MTGLLGLHISFKETTYFLQRFSPDKTKVLIGHYEDKKKDKIIKTFQASPDVSDFNIQVLEEGETQI